MLLGLVFKLLFKHVLSLNTLLIFLELQLGCAFFTLLSLKVFFLSIAGIGIFFIITSALQLPTVLIYKELYLEYLVNELGVGQQWVFNLTWR